MKNVRNIALSIISGALLAGAAWALPASPAGHQSGTQSQAAQLQSASGKITAVSSSSFTLKTMSTPPSREASAQSQDPNQSKDQGKEMTFTIDQNTTVDGKLAVGANADVSYRTDANGNNVAVTVHVTPQS